MTSNRYVTLGTGRQVTLGAYVAAGAASRR